MSQPPIPPAGATEYLAQLADYYRELVEYHQQQAIRITTIRSRRSFVRMNHSICSLWLG